MDKQVAFLKNFCRLCGNSVKNKADVAKKAAFKRELLENFNINIDEDSSEIHPEKVSLTVNYFTTVSVNREMELKFPYQEQLRSGQTMWKTIADAHQERKGIWLKKESTDSCLVRSEEVTPKAGKNTKQRRRETFVQNSRA